MLRQGRTPTRPAWCSPRNAPPAPCRDSRTVRGTDVPELWQPHRNHAPPPVHPPDTRSSCSPLRLASARNLLFIHTAPCTSSCPSSGNGSCTGSASGPGPRPRAPARPPAPPCRPSPPPAPSSLPLSLSHPADRSLAAPLPLLPSLRPPGPYLAPLPAACASQSTRSSAGPAPPALLLPPPEAPPPSAPAPTPAPAAAPGPTSSSTKGRYMRSRPSGMPLPCMGTPPRPSAASPGRSTARSRTSRSPPSWKRARDLLGWVVRRAGTGHGTWGRCCHQEAPALGNLLREVTLAPGGRARGSCVLVCVAVRQ